MKKVLLAGSTGYLGRHIAAELVKQGYQARVIARSTQNFEKLNIQVDEIIQAQVTDSSTLQYCFKDVEVVISSVGITRQKDGLTYMDVDYQANKNLLDAAKKNGVKKFIYVSLLKGDQLKHIQICKAKELFVDELKKSGLDYCIIRPGGFFSDMEEFYNMAKRGRVYLFGDGRFQSNPIHGADLAEICVDAITINQKEIEAGGPEVLTQEEMAQVAFDALGKKAKITYLPDWFRRFSLKLGIVIMSKVKYGPFEFFLTVMAMDLIGPVRGTHTLYSHYKSINPKYKKYL